MGIEAYSTSPDANVQYMPENQAPGTANNGVRGIQADMAEVYNDPGWWRPGAPARTITRVSGNVFREPGVNVSTLYHAGRRVRAIGTLTGTIYGAVSSASYTGGNTDVSVDWDSGSLQAEAITVHLSIAPVYSTSWLQRASTSWRGIVELATDDETIAGVADNIAVTPAGLNARTATGSRNGLVQLADGGEVQGLTEGFAVVTPLGLSFLTPSTTRLGLVTLASSSEVIAGTEGSKVVTPLGLAALTATTARRGLVELATDAEVDAGTDTERAVTPAGLAQLLATTSLAGLVELATDAETLAGSASNRAITPAGFASLFDLSSGTSEMEFPGGFKLKFGSGTTGGAGTAAIGYPNAFSSYARVFLTANVLSFANMQCTSSGNGSFTAFSTDADGVPRASVPFFWLAVGV